VPFPKFDVSAVLPSAFPEIASDRLDLRALRVVGVTWVSRSVGDCGKCRALNFELTLWYRY
jgi:hypothetical protein